MLPAVRLLMLIGALCAAALLLSALKFWRMTRQESAATAPRPRNAVPDRRAQHPRPDFSAGVAPSAQSIRSGARRRDGLRVVPAHDASETSPEPRPDRAYYNEDLGDLSDPDLRKPPRSVRPADHSMQSRRSAGRG